MTKWWLSVTWQSGTQCEGLPPINLSNPSNMCSWEVTWQIDFISSLSQCLWSLRLIRMVTCWKELQPVNLHDRSMRWSFKMTWCIKYMISPPSEDSCTPNQAICWITSASDSQSSLNSFEYFITWHTWGHVTISKIYMSTISTPGRVLTYGRRFSMQTLKSSPGYRVFPFFHCSEKMIFRKELHWNMIFLILSSKMTSLFPQNMI